MIVFSFCDSMFKFWFDEHHLLALEAMDGGYSKDYSLCLSWCKILSKDKGILIYNKRQWRIIHLKEISDGMQACYLQEKHIGELKLNTAMIENAFAIFQWFNEETWEKYHYLPFFSKDVETLEKDLHEFFWLKLNITKEAQGTFVRWVNTSYEFPKDLADILSFIFALIGIYWRFDEKNWEVSAIRVHVPLVWWTHIDEELDEAFKVLSENYWLFIASQRVQNWGKTVYQFASNDRELLKFFVDWVNISRKTEYYKLDNYFKKQQEIKDQLVEYIKNEESLNIDWKDEVLKLLDNHDVKFIKSL